MRKALLMSILIATFWLPLAAARDENPRRGLRLLRKRFNVFCVIYVLTVIYVVPRM